MLDELIPKLEVTIEGGCSTPTLLPVYTRRLRIQMPRVLTEAEQVELEVSLNVLPCNVQYVTGLRGKGMDMHLYEGYQGG